MNSNKSISALLALAMALFLTDCFTGVESTPTITDKDVSRTISELERRQPSVSLKPYCDSIPSWKQGKRFYVTDNQVKMLFRHSQDINVDSVSLAGQYMTYEGYDTSIGYDNRDIVTVNLSCQGVTYTYNTGKEISELTPAFSIPLLVDMDMVDNTACQIEGKDTYIKTPVWYDIETGNMITGRHFIKVHIDKVEPGNKVLPLKVVFSASDNGQRAFVWMSASRAAINNRDYDSLFSIKNPRDNYPDVSATNWDLIVHGKVTLGMTKDECRLALGAPKSISRQPNQSEVREYWYYDGGGFLQFVDGLLRDYR